MYPQIIGNRIRPAESSLMRTQTVLQAIRCPEAVRGALPRALITTDRVLQRWAVSIGIGMPADEWDDIPKAKPPPLPADVAIEVDQMILDSPPRTRDIITRWYKTPQPAEVMAKRLHMTPRNVYRYHTIALQFMRWKFEGSDIKELVNLVRALD